MPKKRRSVSKKRLIRYLEPGDKLIVKGVKGKRVKEYKANRKYVLEVYRKGKLYGYVNNTQATYSKKKVRDKLTGQLKSRSVRSGVKPIAKQFTRSMIARLKYTTAPRQQLGETSKSSIKWRVKSNKRFKSQLPKKLIPTIRKNKGKAFNLRIKVGKHTNVITPYTYIGGKMDDEALKNLIISNFLYTLGGLRLRVSTQLRNLAKSDLDEAIAQGKRQEIIDEFRRNYDKYKRQSIDSADVQLEFREIMKTRSVKRKKRKVPKDRM